MGLKLGQIMSLASKIFWGAGPKSLDRDYKIEHASDHVAKFCADRLMYLEDLVLKKRNKNCCKT